jgi:lactate racemase
MHIEIPYGKAALFGTVPDDVRVDLLEPPAIPPAPDPLEAVEAALEAPLGGFDFGALTGVRTAAIAINDKTRPVPHTVLLPPLLRRLEALGLAPTDIHLIVATGLHAPMRPEEFPAILPSEVLQRYPVESHDARDPARLVYRGETGRGTPVWVNLQFAEADLRIVLGAIEPHQFEGFSGGVKSAAIGLGGANTIQHNHVLMSLPGARLGEFEANPARQDVEEIGAKIGVHFALNAVLNQSKLLVHALAGEPRAVMTSGVPLARQACQLAVTSRYDALIVSAGGHPKDINLYQAQKALAHAALVARPGATIILCAACPEGAGSQGYESWMQGKGTFTEVLERFRQEAFQIGPHKAFLIARDAIQFNLLFVSEMEEARARALLLPPVGSLQQAIDFALARLPRGGRVGVLPHASSTIPYLEGETV